MASMVPWVRNFPRQFVFGGGKYKTPTRTGCQNLLETARTQDWQSVSRYAMASRRATSEVSNSKQANADLRAALASLSQAERDAILDRKCVIKLPAKDINKSETSAVSAHVNEDSSHDHTLKNAPTEVADGDVVSFLHTLVLWSIGLI